MNRSTSPAPRPIEPAQIGASVTEAYHNRSLATINDHEVRLSVMTHGFAWHHHPDSDETFLVVDGELVIEFENQEVVLQPGQMLTVPRGTVHRTRPNGERSVNLTFERKDAATIFLDR
jgi:mannose-6-phosphate isomerase-like protein (cupin superfamily)